MRKSHCCAQNALRRDKLKRAAMDEAIIFLCVVWFFWTQKNNVNFFCFEIFVPSFFSIFLGIFFRFSFFLLSYRREITSWRWDVDQKKERKFKIFCHVVKATWLRKLCKLLAPKIRIKDIFLYFEMKIEYIVVPLASSLIKFCILVKDL